MVVDDGDEKRGNRTTIFENKYTHFGGFITRKGKLTIATLFFADTGDFKVKIPGQPSTYTTTSYNTTTSVPTAYSLLDLGKELIY